MNDLDNTVLRNIACAVINQAVEDAKNGNEEAAMWLKSRDAELYLDEFGLDHDMVKSFANKVLKKIQ